MRTTLFIGCCAVSDTPAVCVWNRSLIAPGSVAPYRSRQPSRPDPPGGAELRDLLEEVDVRVEEEREPGRERVHVQPALLPELDVGEPVRERERELLRRRRAGLADVVAGDAHRMPLGDALGAERHQVADQPEVRARREDPFLLRDVLLEDVGLQRARRAATHATPCRSAVGQEERERDDGRPADRHRGGDVAERDAVEQRLEVLERVGRDAAAPDLALARGSSESSPISVGMSNATDSPP